MKKLLLSLFAAVCSMGFAQADDAADDAQVLIDSDFSVFTDGSEQSPKSLYTSSLNAKTPGYNFISGVSDAGGKLLVGPSGYLTLNQFADLPSAGGTIRVTLELKMIDDYGGAVQFTRGYSTSDVVYAMVESDEWTTVTVYAGGYTSTSASRLRVQPFLSVSGFYLKSLKVEYSPSFISAPEAYLPSDADGTQFTASCSRVSGASKYEADVFSLDENDAPLYFVQDVEMTALSSHSNPSAKITGLDPNTQYYYVARAVNANGKKSENSETVQVVKRISSIDAPVALSATNITEEGFTANWEAVADAKSYVVYVYENETLATATEASVFAEDFSGVNVGTISNIEFNGQLDDFTIVPGWESEFSTRAFAAGYFVFYPSEVGTLTTPEINLSANDGKFTATLNGFTGQFGSMYATENTIGAELLVGDEVVETATTLTCGKAEATDFVFNFTKGTENSRIRFTYTLAKTEEDNEVKFDTNKLYVDAINIKQLLPAGSVITNTIANQASETTSAEVKISPAQNKEYLFGVVAIGQTVLGSGSSAYVGELLSPVSNLVAVDFGTLGINGVDTEANAPKAWNEGDGVIGVNGGNVAIYDVMGRTVYHQAGAQGVHTISLGKIGLVIVVVDGNSYKIVL